MIRRIVFLLLLPWWLAAAEPGAECRLAVGYLLRNLGPDGRFVYLRGAGGAPVPDEYNVLRHCGAVYALGLYYERTPNPKVARAMAAAAKHVVDNYLRPLDAKGKLLAVWDDADPKLGGAGLGLLALLAAERVDPDVVTLTQLRALGRFVLCLQKPDGDFHSEFDSAAGRPSDRWRSLYYPGEAALGLLALHDRDPDPKWLEAAAKALLHLAERRKGKTEVEPDHWALLATAKLLSLDVTLPPGCRGKLVAHAATICGSILRAAEAEGRGGCLTADGRTCPTATRLEGIEAALTFLPERDVALRRRIEARVEAGTAFLARSMLKKGPLSGGMPAVAPGRGGGAKGTEIRIDYVQHALSALLAR